MEFLREFKRKVSRGNVKQEMEPLAAHDECAETPNNYGATHYQFVDVASQLQYEDEDQHSNHAEVKKSSSFSESSLGARLGNVSSRSTTPRPTDLPLPPSDDTDFSPKAIFRSDAKEKLQNRPSLKIFALTQSPTLGSPDSDIDVLGYLDNTPDTLPDTNDSVGSLPYSRVYETSKFSELMPGAFVPNRHVQLRITKVQPIHSHIHIFNNHMLMISMAHGDYSWTVQKKVMQVASLHSVLVLLRTRLKMPAATRVTRQRRQSMRQQIKQAEQATGTPNGENCTPNNRQLRYPRRALQTMDDTVKADLETYLENLLRHPLFRSHHAVLDFFEISPVSFINELGEKIKEGYVGKRTGSGNPHGCCNWCSTCTGKYKNRWLVLKETCLFFLAPESGQVRTVMLMDSGFQISHSYRLIGARNSLLISNLSRSLMIKCDSESSKKEWYSVITKTQRKYAKDFTNQDLRYGSFAPVRRGSYARWYVDGARYMWDVADMLEGAKEEIFITDWWMSPQIYLKRPDLTGRRWRLGEILRRKAESGVRVFILLYKEVELALGISSLLTKHTVNQLHPNIKVLRHPDHLSGGVLYWAHHEKLVIIDQMYAFVSGIDLAFGRWDDYRHKLVDIGHAGVQASPVRQGILGSALQQLVRGTNEVLMNTVNRSTPSSRRTSLDASVCGNTTQSTTASSLFLNPNESESPKRSDESPERNVAENASVVHGEDTVDHSGTVGIEMTAHKTSSEDAKNNISNEKISGESTAIESMPLQSSAKTLNAKSRFFRREPKSVKDPSQLSDQSSDDEQREGKMGKSFREVRKIGLELVEEVKEKGREVRAWTAHKLPQLHRRNSSDSEISDSSSDEGETVQNSRNRFYKRHKLKLATKEKMGSCSSLAHAHNLVTMEDTTSTHLWVGKDYVNWISKDLDNLDEPFKDIVNRHHTPRMPWHDIGLFVEGPAARDAARHFIQRWNAVKTEKVKPNANYPYLVPRSYNREYFVPSNMEPKHQVKCQVVRSVGNWSAGLDEDEASIFAAYVDLIRKAKHYIYIENQFFITCGNINEQKEVTNYIGHEIVDRIVRAHNNGEVFRVFILLPLLPAFEGMIGKSSGIAMQYIVYWNYMSISRGKSSVIHCLKERGVTDWERYVSFCSLRTHENLGDHPVSELVYIHSKLMIVDDRFVIAGSANINDRSLNGNRDSEVCLVIEDQEFEESIMNGKPYQAGVFAGSMRKYLFCEHLGIQDCQVPAFDVCDPISDAFFVNVWSYIANKNTLIYEEVFSCYPCNSATTFQAVDELRNVMTLAHVNPTDAQARLQQVQGHLVQFPLDFLKDEILKPGVGTKEYLLPMETWT
ncbi:phospholipase D1 isoform X2 [Procambarus clarkii]|uniref:phospholipase D1 isoform X2 n=1 Tax=Procambarus clarkii TaxID=6728 RepID=UPI001E670779|nr:phospholipase D1-like isoform X2 [Procambarus clarkii]